MVKKSVYCLNQVLHFFFVFLLFEKKVFPVSPENFSFVEFEVDFEFVLYFSEILLGLLFFLPPVLVFFYIFYSM